MHGGVVTLKAEFSADAAGPDRDWAGAVDERTVTPLTVVLELEPIES